MSDNVEFRIEQLKDWKALDATKGFRKVLEQLYANTVEQAVCKGRSDSRDEAIDTSRGVKLALKELDRYMEGE